MTYWIFGYTNCYTTSSSLEDGCAVDVDGGVGVVCSPDISVDGVRKVSLSAAT